MKRAVGRTEFEQEMGNQTAMTGTVASRKWGTGDLLTMEVEGELTSELKSKFIDRDCRALSWMPKKGGSCEGVEDLSGSLELLVVQSSGRVDDSAVMALSGLRHLDLMTRARNPLDLSSLGKLDSLAIDDRPGLAGIGACPARMMRFAYTKRPVSDFSVSRFLRNLTLEPPRSHTVDLRGDLPQVEAFAIMGGRVTSLEDMRAPNLVNLTIDVRKVGDFLDLSPLLEFPRLGNVNISGLLAEPSVVEAIRRRGVTVWVRDMVEPGAD